MKIACAYIPSHSTSPFTTANALKESPPKKKKSSSGSGGGIPNVWDQILIHVSERWRQVKTQNKPVEMREKIECVRNESVACISRDALAKQR